jgi:hypothetical protein
MPTARKLSPEDRYAIVRPLLDAQTRVVEAIEGSLVSDDHDEVDGLLADAMRKIASARSANREAQRKRLGLVTIAEVG